METQKFYIIHELFTGKPSSFEELNHNFIIISWEKRENSTGETARTIQMTCDSEVAALETVQRCFSEYREVARVFDGSTIWFEKTYKTMTADATWDICLPVLKEVSADTSDDEICRIIAKRNDWAKRNVNCELLWLAAWNLLMNHRDALAYDEEYNRPLM